MTTLTTNSAQTDTIHVGPGTLIGSGIPIRGAHRLAFEWRQAHMFFVLKVMTAAAVGMLALPILRTFTSDVEPLHTTLILLTFISIFFLFASVISGAILMAQAPLIDTAENHTNPDGTITVTFSFWGIWHRIKMEQTLPNQQGVDRFLYAEEDQPQ